MDALFHIDGTNAAKGARLLEAVHAAAQFVPNRQRRIYRYDLTSQQRAVVEARVFRRRSFSRLVEELDISDGRAWDIERHAMRQLPVFAPVGGEAWRLAGE